MEGFTVKSAPKRIWGIPNMDLYSCCSCGVFWSVQCSEDDAEYILAAEHDRLMAEKDAEIAALQARAEAAEERVRVLEAFVGSLPPAEPDILKKRLAELAAIRALKSDATTDH